MYSSSKIWNRFYKFHRKIALRKKDFIEFNTPAEATTFSKGLSKYISQLRKGDN